MSSLLTIDAQETPSASDAGVASVVHTVGLMVILLGAAAAMYFSADHMRAVEHPNRLMFYFTTMAWEWFLTAYVLFGVRHHGTSLVEVTGARWKTAKDVFRDIGLALLFWMAALGILGVTSSLVHFGGSKQNLSFLAPEGPAQIAAWLLVCATAGFCEETIFRGYLQKQFVAWTKNESIGIVLSAVIFGACHIYQGPKAVVVITVYGLLFGILARWRKSLRPGMITHALHDTAGGLAVRFLPS